MSEEQDRGTRQLYMNDPPMPWSTDNRDPGGASSEHLPVLFPYRGSSRSRSGQCDELCPTVRRDPSKAGIPSHRDMMPVPLSFKFVHHNENL
jgi:hypothetical protein